MNCLFCAIIAREISAHIVYDDAHAVGFLDAHPRATGHTLVVPKRHAETIFDIPTEDMGGLFSAVSNTAALLEKGFSPDGFTIGINQGKASGQAVEHLHIHIMPRWHTDGGSSIHAAVDHPPRDPLAAIAKKIQNTRTGS